MLTPQQAHDPSVLYLIQFTRVNFLEGFAVLSAMQPASDVTDRITDLLQALVARYRGYDRHQEPKPSALLRRPVNFVQLRNLVTTAIYNFAADVPVSKVPVGALLQTT